jgi:hypothetical protein
MILCWKEKPLNSIFGSKNNFKFDNGPQKPANALKIIYENQSSPHTQISALSAASSSSSLQNDSSLSSSMPASFFKNNLQHKSMFFTPSFAHYVLWYEQIYEIWKCICASFFKTEQTNNNNFKLQDRRRMKLIPARWSRIESLPCPEVPNPRGATNNTENTTPTL